MTQTTIRHSNGAIDHLIELADPVAVDSLFGVELATHILRWYNRSERSWVVSYATEEGHQIGESTYVASRGESDAEVARLIRAAIVNA
jgi:hypothetical protein